jgi:hypothetical protein
MFAPPDARQSDEAMSTGVEQAAAKLDELVRRGRPRGRPARRPGNGPSPLVVIGAAFVAGLLGAKVIDWRSHAHPRR